MTSWGNFLRGAVLAMGAVVVLSGCEDSAGGTSNSTAPVSVTTSAATKSADPDAALWDPCGLPEGAISGTGLDAATKTKDVAGVDFTGWKVCSWRATARWYSLGVLSGTPTMDDIRRRSDFEAFSTLTVGTHQAVQFLDIGDAQRLNCTVAMEVPRGTVMFYVTTRYSVGKQGDPCVQARSHAQDLVSYLPGS
ncbi:DUF3558 domain-containing protein [Nocardia arthritidis]|uniref:DUF3558 domain-containing protein n=1 Tax=Nocardia arthritidis TaxID=228602 RepID=UPI0007A4CA64|nr:DUF3558 domain-containing protein [Nocardia arthritidis]